jgi:hypothetical protein
MDAQGRLAHVALTKQDYNPVVGPLSTDVRRTGAGDRPRCVIGLSVSGLPARVTVDASWCMTNAAGLCRPR